MPKKPTLSQITERLIYILAVIFTPSIPLFFLFSKNTTQGLLFRHFLIMGGALALISLVIYLPVSKFLLRRRRTMIIIAFFWSAFWFFIPIYLFIVSKNNYGLTQAKMIGYLLFLIIIIGFIFRYISMNRLVANTIAVLLCLMFLYNFVPSALVVSASKKQRLYNEKTRKLPYEVKTEFNIDPDLPKPNIYWIHMDGMLGFDAVERYFNDPQTALKNDLTQRGFVINKNAILEAGSTLFAVPALTSPTFYDSYLAGEFIRVAKLLRKPREVSLSMAMTEKGFSLDDIFPQTEILKALSNAGYKNIGNFNIYNKLSKNLDIWLIDNNVITGDLNIFRAENNTFGTLNKFKGLITDTSALSAVKPKIDKIFEGINPIKNTQPLPAYQEIVDKYATKDSDSYSLVKYGIFTGMADVIRGTKYATTIENPHFVYFNNLTAHTPFIYDENGNYYKERSNSLFVDVRIFYMPQHKYAAKQMIAQVDTIINNDPDAVIILQSDHGIHTLYSFKHLSSYGFNLEDQLNLNLCVMSAVRIPPKFGKLSQPLDPLDITRYLVNNFVGKGNYDYLYYKEEASE